MSDKVFERENEIAWECSNCGHIHYGVKAPELCPVCRHPKAYFAQQSKNYQLVGWGFYPNKKFIEKSSCV